MKSGKTKELDIFDSTRRPVKCIKNDKDAMMVSSENHHLLEVGRVYTLIKTIVYNWNTDVFLEEFPGIPFNSVIFEEVK